MDEGQTSEAQAQTAESVMEKLLEQEGLDDNARSIVSRFWLDSIVMPLKWVRRRDDLPVVEAGALTIELFEALHQNWHTDDSKLKPRYFWVHQKFDPLQANEDTRGMSIDKPALLKVAARYISLPAARTNQFDWVLLDSIVFQELDAFGYHVINTKGGTGFNLAWAFSGPNEGKYLLLTLLFSVLAFALFYIAPPALAIYLLNGGREIAAMSVAVLWVAFVIYRLVGAPLRWRARKRSRDLLQKLLDIYTVLGQSTISPRKLKETLDSAASAGVVLDGAVFAIVDRMLERDATAFVPTRAS